MSSEVWAAAVIGGIVGYALALITIFIYKKYLADTNILTFMLEQFKRGIQKQMDDIFPEPPKKEEKK